MTQIANRSTTRNLQHYVPPSTVPIEDYTEFIGARRVEELRRQADRVEGRSWANINATLQGGGVAEMLASIVPLAQGLGIDAHWYAIQGRQEFFQITKKFHNLLQGVDQPISLEELFGEYLDQIERNARDTLVTSDMIVVHDPQPAAMIMSGILYGNVLWRCHIDTSSPNRYLWRFLLPYINQCSGAIFTQKEFMGDGLRTPVYQIHPCIDPLALKNHHYSLRESLEILGDLFNEHDIDPGRPILAAISRYDIHKNQASILQAFRRLRDEKKYDPAPYLIFLGNTATDDPEGGAMLDALRQGAGGDPDVRFWVNVKDNDRVVGALMRIARAFVHVPTREGFGLVVSEALWQGTPVIGSRTGGVTKQVLDEKTGCLVDPLDTESIAERMAHLLDRPEEAEALGEGGRDHVRRNFLLPELVSRYLILLQHLTGERAELPPFRVDHVAYTDILHALRPRHPELPSRSIHNGPRHPWAGIPQ